MQETVKKEYIEREAIREYFHLGVDCNDCEQDARRCRYFDEITRMDICSAIDDIPAADVVAVVRCRECKWFAEGKWCRNPNNDMVQGGTTGEWFCANGRRKGGDE